jgi:hypothetical protein
MNAAETASTRTLKQGCRYAYGQPLHPKTGLAGHGLSCYLAASTVCLLKASIGHHPSEWRKAWTVIHNVLDANYAAYMCPRQDESRRCFVD